MSESTGHAKAVNLIEAIVDWWVRSQPNTQVEHNLGIRWVQQHPGVGIDPDVSVFRPALPDNPTVSSVRTWIPGYTVPILAIEVVSETNPRKDYEIVPDKYHASGTGELCIFDPFLDRFQVDVRSRRPARRCVCLYSTRTRPRTARSADRTRTVRSPACWTEYQ